MIFLKKWFSTNVNKGRKIREALASKYSQANQFRESIKIYEDLLHEFPDDPKILVNLGLDYFKLDQNEQAFDCYTRVIEQANEGRKVRADVLSLAWTNLGAFYEYYTYYEEAYVRYRMAIKLYHNNWLAKKYLKQLEKLADKDYGPLGIRRLPNGKEVTMLWDGSFIIQNRDKVIIL